MTMSYNERELARLGDKDLAKIVAGVHEAFRKRHLEMSDIALPTFDKAKNSQAEEAVVLLTPEVIVAKHVDRYVKLSFHRVVYPKLSDIEAEAKYRSDFKLPEAGTRQPETYKGRFDLLATIDPRISLARKHKLAGIAEYINTDKISNLTPVPARPYAIWTHDANRYRKYTVDQATAKFADDEVGSPQVEVTDFYLNYPQFFKDHGVDASGSRHEDDCVPDLNTFRGWPRVDASWSGAQNSDWGALSRGKEIIELGS